MTVAATEPAGAVGTTRPRQVWGGGDPAWRPVAELTLTCDHRAVDGATGAGFLATLRTLLEGEVPPAGPAGP